MIEIYEMSSLNASQSTNSLKKDVFDRVCLVGCKPRFVQLFVSIMMFINAT